jgi:hypothetical protein
VDLRVEPGKDAEQLERLQREVMHLLSLPEHRHLMGVTSITMVVSGTIVGYMMPFAELGDLQQVKTLNSQNNVAYEERLPCFYKVPSLKQFWFAERALLRSRTLSPMASKTCRLQAKVHMPCDGHAASHGCLDLQNCAFLSSCSAASSCCTNMALFTWT